MTEFQQKVLSYLNINENDLPNYIKRVTKNDLENPYDFLNMEIAVNRIKKAILNQEKIMIYGDYDCDGISATSILVKMFQSLNLKVGFYIPSRYIDGYGINLNRAKQIEDKGYTLVITVDNGVAAGEAINYLTSKNIDVILTDHHDITRELPDCLTILHPTLKRTDASLKQCGAYVAFMLSIGVLGRVDDYLLTLASQATISDMMPLKGFNRDLVKLSFEILNNHKDYPQHKLINNKDAIIDEDVFGFQICPKINAFGRIKEDTSVNDMVRFFVTNDVVDQYRIANEIEEINVQRKQLLNESVNKIDFKLYADKKIIIERFDNISEGVIGLLAARILNECNKPCIVFTKIHNQDILKGSARSLKGFSLSDAFDELSSLLLVYGGHEEAGGLSLNIDKYDEFCISAEKLIESKIIEISEDKYIEINNDDVNYENYKFIKSLSPFGMEHNKPKFLLNILNKNTMYMGNLNQHIRGNLSKQATFVGFSMSHLIKDIPSFKALGQINYDDFRKRENVVFLIEKIISSN